MEYYSAIKTKDIMNFVGKWMELENIILRVVIQTLKENTNKRQDTHTKFHRPPKNPKKKGPSNDA